MWGQQTTYIEGVTFPIPHTHTHTHTWTGTNRLTWKARVRVCLCASGESDERHVLPLLQIFHYRTASLQWNAVCLIICFISHCLSQWPPTQSQENMWGGSVLRHAKTMHENLSRSFRSLSPLLFPPRCFWEIWSGETALLLNEWQLVFQRFSVGISMLSKPSLDKKGCGSVKQQQTLYLLFRRCICCYLTLHTSPKTQQYACRTRQSHLALIMRQADRLPDAGYEK